jgi:hypothetical protein
MWSDFIGPGEPGTNLSTSSLILNDKENGKTNTSSNYIITVEAA